jgi:hypothetical protein
MPPNITVFFKIYDTTLIVSGPCTKTDGFLDPFTIKVGDEDITSLICQGSSSLKTDILAKAYLKALDEHLI